ncbi:hypothetical protein L2E82_10292 [Cichorium intybus]|uniref:Uncharacterized protein n=1 Tax=Cichorium intybus TaxID=13427 RepID=A0ACB9GA85_CICIN|nr:hypothetical protein L2E82_10292 [Cichorium intybus]
MNMAIFFVASILVLCGRMSKRKPQFIVAEDTGIASRPEGPSRREGAWLVVGALFVGSVRLRCLAIRKLVVSRWRGFAMEVFASRPPSPSRRDRCGVLVFCFASSSRRDQEISDVVINCDLLTAFVGCDFVVSSFVRLAMQDDKSFLDVASLRIGIGDIIDIKDEAQILTWVWFSSESPDLLSLN